MAEPTLTDQELAKWEAEDRGAHTWTVDVNVSARAARPRLIAALRDSRAETERMRGAAQFIPPAPPALTDNAGLVWQAGYRAACERVRRAAPTLT